jgi:glycosyltransferase involved in cell wall biosynthesis
VAANVGGLPDLIESGQTGVLCDPLDPLSIQNSIDKVLLDPAAASGMARRAKQRALEKFHPKVIASRHLELYHEVLNSRS